MSPAIQGFFHEFSSISENVTLIEIEMLNQNFRLGNSVPKGQSNQLHLSFNISKRYLTLSTATLVTEFTSFLKNKTLAHFLVEQNLWKLMSFLLYFVLLLL